MIILLQHLISYIDLILIALNLYVYKNQPFELFYRFWHFSIYNFALHAVLLAQYLDVIKPAEIMQSYIQLMIQSHILIS